MTFRTRTLLAVVSIAVVLLGTAGVAGISQGAQPGLSDRSQPIEAADESEQSILIMGVRGDGDATHMVYVDGVTVGLVGQRLTPYFRFPGQTGFTAGSGSRNADANGDFAWQRRTGKQITVEFRSGEVRSNQVTIPAR